MIVTAQKTQLHQAILQYYPGSSFAVDSTTFVISFWQCPNAEKPSPDMVRSIYQAYMKNNAYIAARVAAYPKVADQLDAIMKGFAALSTSIVLPDATLAWIKACQDIKSTFPKPTSTNVATVTTAPVLTTIAPTTLAASPIPIMTPAPITSAIPIWNTPATLPHGTHGTSYSVQLSAIDSGSTITYTLALGQSLPSGLTISNDGMLSGTLADTATSATFQVDATNISGTSTQTFILTVL